MEPTDQDERLTTVPIFPLARVVLLPGEVLPLHVFEPRYRAMVAHVMATDRRLAIATIDPDKAGDSMVPALWQEIGIGRVVRLQELPDGRSNLWLAAVGGARIVEEIATEDPFRTVRALRTPEPAQSYGPDPQLRLLAAQVGAMLAPRGMGALPQHLDGSSWTDAMARRFVHDPAARRAYLGSDQGETRRQILQDALLDWLGRLEATTAEA